MAKTEKQKDKSKKKKVIIGTLCGIAAAALIAGVTIPCVMCHRSESKILVTFTSEEQGVTITPDTIEVPAGTTFGKAKSQVFAQKVLGNNPWLLSDWQRKDGEELKPILDSFEINEPLNVTPVFVPLTEDDLIVNFTPAPGDTGVSISSQQKTIEKGTTFAQVKDDVIATKDDDDRQKWNFKWWYKDGESSDRRMSNDVIVNENLTVHPYFEAEPIEKVTVNFVPGEQETGDVTIHSTGGTRFTVDKYTDFGQIIKDNNISATRSDDAIFQYWGVYPFVPIPGKEWTSPTEVKNETKLVDNVLTVFPYFVARAPEWTEKEIWWENYQSTEDGDYDTPFSKEISIYKAPQVETYQFTLSHFILADPFSEDRPEESEGEAPLVLDQGDEISIEYVDVPTQYSSIFKNKPEIINSEGSKTPNKLNIKFEFDTTGFEKIEEPISFGLKFEITNTKFGKSRTSPTISDFSLIVNAPEPEVEPLNVTYVSPTSPETFETLEGYRSVSINSYERSQDADPTTGYFVLDREIRSDEKLQAVVLGNNADNVQVTNLHVQTVNNISYVNFDVGFIKIDGIGMVHMADFQLKFVVTVGSLEQTYTSEIEDNFTLKFTPDKFHPYSVVMDNTYETTMGGTEINFTADVENVERDKSYFKKGDFLTVRNLTRENNPTNPIWFSSPQEAGNPLTPAGAQAPIIPLEGQDIPSANIRLNFCYTNDNPAPKIKTPYTVDLQFDFYEGTISDEGWINSVNKQVTFVYDPTAPLVYSNDLWAQAHSFAIVQKAKKNGQIETKLGTGWILSKESRSGISYYAVTSYEVKKDYNTFASAPYTEHTFGISFPSVAKQYLPNDSQKYILIDDGSEFAQYDPDDNNDIIELQINDSAPENNGWVWENNLYWERNFLFFKDYIGPDIAVATLRPGHIILNEPNEILSNRYSYNFDDTLNKWAANDLSTTDVQEGQLTGIYNPTDDKDFDKSLYSYGYVGGFDSKEITLPNGTKTNALYWKSFDKTLGGGKLDLVGTTTYFFGCDGDGEILGGTLDNDPITHRCPAFTLINDAFLADDYFGPAGRGAMFLLRPRKLDQTMVLLPPIVAGVNWNGGSLWNVDGHITPYFDCFAFDSNRTNRNLLGKYMKPFEP